ncbi:MAG: hypothetical protein TU36_000660 [Vulcanisaeta sp. AZ3]|jgi:hypothetical protein|nr:MAG: hypothetical protein TU36_00700 [Vulcanisaeta sp. AZ3]
MNTDLGLLGLRKSNEIKGKYVDLVIYTAKKDNKAFLEGIIKCPFTNKEFKLTITPHTDQVKLGFVQHHGGLYDHIIKTKEYAQWLRVNTQPYSRNSFHKHRYFICAKCGYKTSRFTDALLHLMQNHGFLVKLP